VRNGNLVLSPILGDTVGLVLWVGVGFWCVCCYYVFSVLVGFLFGLVGFGWGFVSALKSKGV